MHSSQNSHRSPGGRHADDRSCASFGKSCMQCHALAMLARPASCQAHSQLRKSIIHQSNQSPTSNVHQHSGSLLPRVTTHAAGSVPASSAGTALQLYERSDGMPSGEGSAGGPLACFAPVRDPCSARHACPCAASGTAARCRRSPAAACLWPGQTSSFIREEATVRHHFFRALCMQRP